MYSLAEINSTVQQLIAVLPSTGLIVVSGEMGAGKTTCVCAILQQLTGQTSYSPTFGILHLLESKKKTYGHIDCYRLQQANELLPLDLPDLLARGALVFVEWGEKFIDVLPQCDGIVEIHIVSENQRKIQYRTW